MVGRERCVKVGRKVSFRSCSPGDKMSEEDADDDVQDEADEDEDGDVEFDRP